MPFYIPTDRSVCLNIVQRQPYGFDFLACEGFHGWSATHVIAPFMVMMFLGDFPLAWIACGLVEIAEALRPSVFGSGTLSGNAANEFETLAGAILGDWAMNDLLGVFCAFVLLRLFALPGLLSGIYSCGRTAAMHRAPKATFRTAYWWKQHMIALIFLGANVLPAWVVPSTCNPTLVGDCINAGLMLSIYLQVTLTILCAVWFMQTSDDKRYLWKPARVAGKKLAILFGVWATFTLVVGIQNAQPYMPLWFVPLFAEFAQVWLAASIVLVGILFIFLLTRRHLKDTQEDDADNVPLKHI